MPKQGVWILIASALVLFPKILLSQPPDTIWTRRYNDPSNRNDCAFASAVDSVGDIYIVGTIYNSPDKFLIIKYNGSTGDTIWTRSFNGPANRGDQAFGCTIDNAGFLYVTGSYYDGSYTSSQTIKYNKTNGDTVWVRRFRYTFKSCSAVGCIVDRLGNLFVVGLYNSADFLTIKYNADTGDTLWVRIYDSPYNGYDCTQSCSVDTIGGLYVTGYSYNGVNDDYLTIKYNASNGDTVWTRRFNGPANGYDEARSCSVDDAGNLYVTGYSRDSSASDNYLTIKYNATTGDTIWTRRYKSPFNYLDDANTCIVDHFGNLYVSGTCCNDLYNYYYILTIKYNAVTGDTVWTCPYINQVHSGDWARSCSADRSGDLYIIGYTANGSTADYLIIKYNTATGVTGKPTYPIADSKLQLAQNKPNPFSQSTVIRYQLPASGPASIKIYNTAGQIVKKIDMGSQQAGRH
ncbi:MAG TPA: SBBP repeat-containing protein, partial [Candidatus Edwardsbacteria bacterium]|nr:SBBP repeat-containing protein [Candidatus Edwardsbacteria bacterium]